MNERPLFLNLSSPERQHLVRGQTQKQVQLEKRLASGGEGCIYTLVGEQELVAKIYHSPTPAHHSKLQTMLHHSPLAKYPTIKDMLAWPVDRVLNSQEQCVGFLMPFIDTAKHFSLATLYHPKSRHKVTGDFTWRSLFQAATNLAGLVAILHATGYVVGDLNESNILVNASAQVTLVDCDSMQVPAGDGLILRCRVGKLEYTPPELQGQDFSQLARLPASDNFGLAILIFMTLMEGVHPFNGSSPDQEKPALPEENIQACIWPYAPDSVLKPAVSALPLNTLPAKVQALLRRCFVTGLHEPEQRPTAREWFDVLETAQQHLVCCRQQKAHWYCDHLAACPWCERATLLNFDPFPLQKTWEDEQARLAEERAEAERARQARRTRHPRRPTSPVRSVRPGQRASLRSCLTTIVVVGLFILGSRVLPNISSHSPTFPKMNTNLPHLSSLPGFSSTEQAAARPSDCPPPDQARAVTLTGGRSGANPNIVYFVNTDTGPQLQRFDTVTQKTHLIADQTVLTDNTGNHSLGPTKTLIGEASISPDGQWILYTALIVVSSKTSSLITEELRLASIDGHALPPLFCTSPESSLTLHPSWSPNQSQIAFALSSTLDSSISIEDLQIRSGKLQTLFGSVNFDSFLFKASRVKPSLVWLNNTQFYFPLITQTSSHIYLLDIRNGTDQSQDKLQQIISIPGKYCSLAWDINHDASVLFTSTNICTKESYMTQPPSAIQARTPSGAVLSTLLQTSVYDIQQVNVANTTTLFVIINQSLDDENRGLWRINTDGTHMKLLSHLILLSPHASDDGTLYAADVISAVAPDDSRNTDTKTSLYYGSIAGGAIHLFADPVNDRYIFGGPYIVRGEDIAGWSRLS